MGLLRGLPPRHHTTQEQRMAFSSDPLTDFSIQLQWSPNDEALLERGEGNSMLLWATRAGRVDVVSHILSCSTDLETPFQSFANDTKHMHHHTPLAIAMNASTGSANCVELLLDARADTKDPLPLYVGC